jgi:hypothetical protein
MTVPSTLMSSVASRPNRGTGVSYRRASLNAAGISEGSARTSSYWPGCAASSAMALPMAAIVESSPAATYWWMIPLQLSWGITPRSAAANTARPMLPSARSPAAIAEAHSKSSPAMGKFAAVRSFMGPSTLNAAKPQARILSRTSPWTPMRSMTTAMGSACARSSIASNVPRSTRPATIASALASMSPCSVRSARGVRFSMSAARSGRWSGGSVARDVPARAWFIMSLKATALEEKARGAPSAARTGS